jgi:hypothetical protein
MKIFEELLTSIFTVADGTKLTRKIQNFRRLTVDFILLANKKLLKD